MNKTALAELIAEIDKTEIFLDRNFRLFLDFHDTDLKLLGRKTTSAMIFSQIVTDFYTALETLFLRISQFFENHLSREAWYKELLGKMTLRIEGVRIALLSEESFVNLSEILRFRHFRRYYFESEYDWDRLDLIEKKYRAAQAFLKSDFAQFRKFLNTLQNSM